MSFTPLLGEINKMYVNHWELFRYRLLQSCQLFYVSVQYFVLLSKENSNYLDIYKDVNRTGYSGRSSRRRVSTNNEGENWTWSVSESGLWSISPPFLLQWNRMNLIVFCLWQPSRRSLGRNAGVWLRAPR